MAGRSAGPTFAGGVGEVSKARLHLDYDALGAVLMGRSGDVSTKALIARLTREAEARAGDGFRSEVKDGPGRVSGRVWTYTRRACKQQRDGHVLEAAVGGLQL